MKARQTGLARRSFTALIAVALCIVGLAGTEQAFAFFGAGGVADTFLKIPNIAGSWRGEAHKGWIRTNARFWVEQYPRFTLTLGIGTPMVSGPPAPSPGRPHKLAIAVDKKNPDLQKLMKLCADKTLLPEVLYAEPAARGPANWPAFWEYRLKDVQLEDCDVMVPDAPEQALVLSFKDIEWLNYDSKGPLVVPVKSTVADIPKIMPVEDSATSKTFLITWFGYATLGDDSACPVMTASSTQDQFYALLPKDQAAAIRAKQGEKPVSYGGPDPMRPWMEERGPHMLSACAMPGIVPDPGHPEPKTTKALGVNLDGDAGSAKPPAAVCKHENFVSEDGHLNGVDNQLYRVYGCVPGFRGKKGYMNQTHNARRADGNVVTLIQISGIDDPKNDDSVEIAIFYAQDKPVRGSAGQFIPNYTFRMTEDPNFARYNQRVRGKIVDGYIITPPMKQWNFNNGQGGNVTLTDAQYRFHIEADGSLKGVVGGYVDWHGMAGGGSYGEQLFNYTCPGIYESFKRNADGMKDPVTGECNGISMAYEVDAIPAFVTEAARAVPQTANADTVVP